GRDGTQVLAARAFLSVGNDEYWTVAERAAVQAARDHGVHCIFLGADQIYWRVRPEASSAGAPERVLAGYKEDQARDPVLASVGPTASTALFRDPPLANPENALSGVGYDSWLLVRQPFIVRDAASWVFAGTGLHDGDGIPFAVAAEYDTRLDDGVEPPGLQLLASSPIINAYGMARRATATLYQAPSGAEVFAVGSIGWVNGLGAGPYADSRVARITRNVLDRFVGPGHQGAPDPAGAPWTRPPATPVIVGAWSPSVVTIAGAADGAPATDGPGASARFADPGGVAVAADGSVYVADTAGQTIRRIAPDAAHTVTTIAGGAIDGYVDGPGASARFRWPLGLAVAADGTLLVADSENNCIRAVASDAAHTVSTYAGQCTPIGGLADGAATSALFLTPVAVAVAPDGGVLVADQSNDRLRRVAPGTHAVTTFAGSVIGFADGAGATARFNGVSGVAVASDGTIYVLDAYNQAIRRIATDAAHTVTTLIGGDGVPAAYVDGSGTVARLGAQGGLAWAAGRLFVSDVAGSRLRAITPGPDSSSTRVATLAGSGASVLSDGDGAHAGFALPTALAAGVDGRLWAIDAGNYAVRAVTLGPP
ncbi:MAG TPA: N,N-dimethylformamidase beta subunit family domain-containing protein, partial [Polyangia bacterium]